MLPLIDDHNQALILTERINSCVSIVSILFVSLTYCFAPGFGKPINRLIFYAGFGNLGSNVAALISGSGPIAGSGSGLCQFQAFLVQMFLGVDCYWALFMAINVYLVFFREFTVEQLRSLDALYLILGYFLSFIPALIFIFVSTESRGQLYGDAYIWCWISVKWDFMRVIFLYAIIWIAFITAFIIYGMAARVIWSNRDKLENYLNPLNENPFGKVVTQIEITHEESPIVHDPSPPGRVDLRPEQPAYTVQVEADPAIIHHLAIRDVRRIREISRNAAQRANDQEAWLYARLAFMFFMVLLITWVPASVNRVYTLVDPDAKIFTLNYASSFVFPLQAFWNCIIYIIGSQSACRRLVFSLFGRRYHDTNIARTASITHSSDIYESEGNQHLWSISGWTDAQSHDTFELEPCYRKGIRANEIILAA